MFYSTDCAAPNWRLMGGARILDLPVEGEVLADAGHGHAQDIVGCAVSEVTLEFFALKIGSVLARVFEHLRGLRRLILVGGIEGIEVAKVEYVEHELAIPRGVNTCGPHSCSRH